MTIKDNVERMFRHWKLNTVIITLVEKDRVFGWDYASELLPFVIAHNWNPDSSALAGIYHGTKFAFREPGNVSPAMQVCFHRTDNDHLYFVEIDFDYAAPTSLWGFWKHVGEVLYNAVTGKKTDQNKVARLLDDRGIPQ